MRKKQDEMLARLTALDGLMTQISGVLNKAYTESSAAKAQLRQQMEASDKEEQQLRARVEQMETRFRQFLEAPSSNSQSANHAAQQKMLAAYTEKTGDIATRLAEHKALLEKLQKENEIRQKTLGDQLSAQLTQSHHNKTHLESCKDRVAEIDAAVKSHLSRTEEDQAKFSGQLDKIHSHTVHLPALSDTAKQSTRELADLNKKLVDHHEMSATSIAEIKSKLAAIHEISQQIAHINNTLIENRRSVIAERAKQNDALKQYATELDAKVAAHLSKMDAATAAKHQAQSAELNNRLNDLKAEMSTTITTKVAAEATSAMSSAHAHTATVAAAAAASVSTPQSYYYMPSWTPQQPYWAAMTPQSYNPQLAMAMLASGAASTDAANSAAAAALSMTMQQQAMAYQHYYARLPTGTVTAPAPENSSTSTAPPRPHYRHQNSSMTQPALDPQFFAGAGSTHAGGKQRRDTHHTHVYNNSGIYPR